MRPPLTRLTAALCVLFAPIALLSVPAPAQTPVQVTVNATSINAAAVDAGSGVGVITSFGHGVNTAVDSKDLEPDPALPGLLDTIGTNALRFPGGVKAENYHWADNSNISVTNGIIDHHPWDTGNNFDNFMSLAKQTGATPIITVNYRYDSNGNAPGDPNEAASWVAYAKAKSYGVKYWEIGNEEYGYGIDTNLLSVNNPTYYGSRVLTYANAMKAQDGCIKIGAVLAQPGADPDGLLSDWNSNVLMQCGSSIDFVIVHYYPVVNSDTTDAQMLSAPSAQVAQITAQTRALLCRYCGSRASQIKIFITETNSNGSGVSKQVTNLPNALFVADETQMWLENGIANVDFWSLSGGMHIQYYANDPNHPNDPNSPNTPKPYVVGNLDPSLYGIYDFAEGSLLSWKYYQGYLPIAPYMTFEPGLPDDAPFPAYYAEEMVGLLDSPGAALGSSGATVISSTTDQPLVSSHAVRNTTNHTLSVMLINKDPNTTYAATVNVAGYTAAWPASSTTYFYGEPSVGMQDANGNPITQLVPTFGNANSTFTQSLPPYSMTTVVLQQQPTATAPLLAATVSPAAVNVQAGLQASFSVNVSNTGTALPAGSIVNVQVTNLTGAVVNSSPSLSQVVKPSGNNFSWTAPSATSANGTYYVSASVTDSTGQTQYYSGSNLAAFQVTTDGLAPPAPDSIMTITTVSAPATMSAGTTANITVSYTNNGASITNMCAELEGYLKPYQAIPHTDVLAPTLRGINLLYGQTQQETFQWTAPTVPGTYFVQGGAFTAGWFLGHPYTTFGYNSGIASIYVVGYVAPAITVAGTVDQPNLAPGATTTIRATATDTGGSLTNGTGFVEVHDPSDKVVATQNIPGLNWNTNQTVAFPPITWTAPGTTGSYTVWAGVMDPSGNPTYKYNSVATINVTPASMAISATATPSTAAPGTIVTINGAATDNGGALSNDIAEIDIYSSSWGAPIGGATYPGQAWNTGQTHTYSTTWTAPGTPGTYYVYMTVKDPSGNPNYGYIPVTTITVPQPVITVANFGFETPGLGNAQYLYRPTGSSWTYPTGNNGVLSNCGIASNGSAFNNLPAPQGSQVAFVQQSGTMSQTVTSGSAGVWTVSVSAAQRTNSAQTVNVLLDGTKIGSVKPTSNPFATYTVTSPSSVSAGSHTLTFQGTTTADNTAFIDNVQVTSH